MLTAVDFWADMVKDGSGSAKEDVISNISVLLQGDDYDSSMDDQCPFSFAFAKAARHKNLTSFIRNREVRYF